MIYDITSQQSLADALEWKKHLDKVIIQQDGKCVPAVLVGNKVLQFLLYESDNYILFSMIRWNRINKDLKLRWQFGNNMNLLTFLPPQ